MARLDRLVLQGFKSFKRKASIPLPPGFSVITGPNGSGKTNLADAVTFVLGKSSSRTLRAKKAEELIFHGSKDKSGSDSASVVLYFDNSSKALPLQDKEVSVGRRINRSGVSTYRLNGRVVTRQQIVDILSQGGISPDGYNIIQQGDVNHIVEMDPVQRRGILDEISGIKEYDEKRGKALKELEGVAERVREAEILLAERGNVMEKLRSDRDAALEHRKLQEELEKITVSILMKDYSNAKSHMDKISGEVSIKESEVKAMEKETARLDKVLEKEEKALQNLTREVVQASSQIEVSRKIARLQSGIESRKERVVSVERERERLESLIERVSRIENKVNPGISEILKFPGVKGVLLELIVIPKEYRTAVDVGAGGHLSDIVVDMVETAVRCVNHLKARKLGRARFLPLDKILPGKKGPLPPACIGWLADLIHFDRKYSPVMEYVFGRTACVKDIETAKEIMKRQRVRMVTLDGDLVEVSGAVTGGYYRQKGGDVKEYLKDKAGLQKEMEALQEEIKAMGKELSGLADKEKVTRTFDMEKERQGLDKRLASIREERKEAYEKAVGLQQELGRLNIQKAKIEARFDSLKMQVPKKREAPLDLSVAELREREKRAMERLQEIGPVNLKAIEEFDSILGEFEEFKEKVDKIAEEKKAIMETIEKIEEKRLTTFMATMKSITANFRDVYKTLTGGEAQLLLENENNLDTGLMIKATPPGKKLLHIDSMSGGEKTLTAFAFLFAIQKHKPAPFYILDEADATLDKVNTGRVVSLIKKQSRDAQFIVISHNDGLVREADQIFGVTMDSGESKVMGIELPEEKAK